MTAERVTQRGIRFHHNPVSIRATAEAPRKAPAPLVLSFGRQGKSDDKNNGTGQAHTLFSFSKLLHSVSLCPRVFVLSSWINFWRTSVQLVLRASCRHHSVQHSGRKCVGF